MEKHLLLPYSNFYQLHVLLFAVLQPTQMAKHLTSSLLGTVPPIASLSHFYTSLLYCILLSYFQTPAFQAKIILGLNLAFLGLHSLYYGWDKHYHHITFPLESPKAPYWDPYSLQFTPHSTAGLQTVFFAAASWHGTEIVLFQITRTFRG